jgi:EAL domain-containing protein (putative c-di-GMP-specific phosphodiesterase class I)
MASTTVLSDDAGRTVGVISVNRPAPDGGPGRRGGEGPERGIADEIAGGIERGEFDVFYQPIVRLDDRATAGVEALVRWHHPRRGLLAPAAFIHVAERTGVIDELGRHVLDRGCAQIERWRQAGHDVHLAVNLSARQIADARLVERVARAMAAHGVGPGVLWLEVTESALVEDLDVATARLDALRELGVGISIDDFGTGWASLTYLHQFPIDALKIDSVFVKGLGARASSTAIVRSIVSLGQELDIAVIAEGIQTESQLDALRELGCTVGQGYLFAEPRPATDVQLGSLLTR